jgi:polygalacturonase
MKNLRIRIPLCFLFLLFFSCSQHRTFYDILDYGAKGDSKTMSTKAINTAITECNSKGGGIVIIPSGKFVKGTIVLLSNVNLNLQPGAVLIGSVKCENRRHFT